MKKNKSTQKNKKKQKAELTGNPARQEAGVMLVEAIPQAQDQLVAVDLFPAAGKLETSRTHWQYGAWKDLVALDLPTIERDPDRAKLALLVSVAHGQLNNPEAARHCALRAIEWGCDRKLVARVLISAVENTHGRTSAALGDYDDATSHFEQAIRLVEPRADVKLMAHTRQIREYASMGLMTEAMATIESEMQVLIGNPEDDRSKLTILKSEVELLKAELILATKRGQLHVSEATTSVESSQDEDLSKRAVSQLGQDLWVLEKTNRKRDGFFVEFGATNGVLLSNTWLLETSFGWSGICAEPNPKFFAELRKNRNCIVSDACIGRKTGETVEFILADVYGSIADYAMRDSHEKRRSAYRAAGDVMFLETVSLEDFLIRHNAPTEIDYLSIDTEGSEFDILSAFPFDKWKIKLITVEHNFTELRDKIKHLLENHGYVRTEARFDDWYELAG